MAEKYWYYLDDPQFHVRQYSVIPFLEKCSTIIEIGCGLNPISKFMHGDDTRYILVEPFLDPPLSPKTTLLKTKIEDLDVKSLNLEDYAFVMFGIDYFFLNEVFLHLWKNSKVAVFEANSALQKHIEFMKSIKKIRQPDIEYDFDICWKGELPLNSWPPIGKRKILIYFNGF